MSEITVGIAEMRVSANPEDDLVTYALGSCIAVVTHDPIRRIGGMIHFMLPAASSCPEKADTHPMMFADTGIPLLFHHLYQWGCLKKDLIVKIAGGAKLYDDNGTFDIGRRNYSILRKIFWKAGVIVQSENVGGAQSRTVRLGIASGRVVVSSQGEEVDL
jgi:chemotaxis protein CheD